MSETIDPRVGGSYACLHAEKGCFGIWCCGRSVEKIAPQATALDIFPVLSR